MEIKKGKKEIKLHGNRETAIVEVLFSNYTLFVFKGELSQNDILIKYASGKGRLRTPKHIHWAVDILLKQQGNRELISI